eukprot:TRINITY_DN2780_c0_g2_i1.p1 TRINITY_DN2780_c0_g2~~TRINITY_DN2780_c0_g2_i1.p1  ORF type:complete len:282 (+),score=52.22 TRINITY_DN2780_c0_g2_i1:220-1065(+)
MTNLNPVSVFLALTFASLVFAGKLPDATSPAPSLSVAPAFRFPTGPFSSASGKIVGLSSSCGAFMNYQCSSGQVFAYAYPEVYNQDQCTGVASCDQDTATSGTCYSGKKYTCTDNDDTLLFEKWENSDCTGTKLQYLALSVSTPHCGKISTDDSVDECEDECGRAQALSVSSSSLYFDTYTELGCEGNVCDTSFLPLDTCYTLTSGDYVKFTSSSNSDMTMTTYDSSNGYCYGDKKEYLTYDLYKFAPGYCSHDDCVTSSATGLKVVAVFLLSALLFLAFL